MPGFFPEYLFFSDARQACNVNSDCTQINDAGCSHNRYTMCSGEMKPSSIGSCVHRKSWIPGIAVASLLHSILHYTLLTSNVDKLYISSDYIKDPTIAPTIGTTDAVTTERDITTKPTTGKYFCMDEYLNVTLFKLSSIISISKVLLFVIFS